MARIVQFIEVEVSKGYGTELQPYYIATQYWTFDGRFMWETPEPNRNEYSGEKK